MFKLDEVCIDNNAFRLHYKVAMIVLALSSALLGARQYFGDPIDCLVDGVHQNVMDTYCWLYSTYTVSKKMRGREGLDFVKPGVGPHVDGEDEVRYHRYYQWVSLVLMIQAICFYTPRYIWKVWEGGRMRQLSMDVHRFDGENVASKRDLVNYLYKNMGLNSSYALGFLFCEFISLINVIAQLVFLDYFLEGEFRLYGLQVVDFTLQNPDERVDPMAWVFPKITKCTFSKYGPSGDIQTIDGLCILTLNNVNEKVFVLVWFVLVAVAIATVINFVYRAAVSVSPRLRLLLLQSRSRLTTSKRLRLICDNCENGDWFVLYQLSKNIHSKAFKEILNELAIKFDPKDGI